MLPLLALLAACTGSEPTDAEPQTLDWTPIRARLSDAAHEVRGRTPARVITHLHSPWSHDACDGDGLIDGEVNQPCLEDLRRGLCEAAIDVAFFSDHPANAADQEYDQLWHPQEGDGSVPGEAHAVGGVIDCGGAVTHWMPGIEDELMPLGLDEHVPGDADQRDATYNGAGTETLTAEIAAGALGFVAHTEQRDVAYLSELQDAGLTGIEIFNAHAMFSPTHREEFLGLDGLSWFGDVAPFMDDDDDAPEPDLLFMGVLQNQAPSLAAFDALLARGPIVGVAGTDAHQNVLTTELRDGERVDSYRRALTWFSNHVMTDSLDPADVKAALAMGRSYVAFEVLGVPDRFDFFLETDTGIVDMGGAGGAGTLTVVCPHVSELFPHGVGEAEVTATLFKDGEVFATGCGAHDTDGPGAYRVEIDIVPWHLEPFLGETPETYLRSYPWVLSNGIRVGG